MPWLDLKSYPIPPVLHVEEIVGSPLVRGRLLRGRHPGGAGDPHPVLPVVPPVPVVELRGRRQLEDVPHVRVEHVEEDVVLVAVQLHRRQLVADGLDGRKHYSLWDTASRLLTVSKESTFLFQKRLHKTK